MQPESTLGVRYVSKIQGNTETGFMIKGTGSGYFVCGLDIPYQLKGIKMSDSDMVALL